MGGERSMVSGTACRPFLSCLVLFLVPCSLALCTACTMHVLRHNLSLANASHLTKRNTTIWYPSLGVSSSMSSTKISFQTIQQRPPHQTVTPSIPGLRIYGKQPSPPNSARNHFDRQERITAAKIPKRATRIQESLRVPGLIRDGTHAAPPLLPFLETLLQVAGPPRCSAQLCPEICVIWKLPSCPT